MYKKPEVPIGQKKELCEKIYLFIRGMTRTKQEIEAHIYPGAVRGSKDRQIRDMISILKKHVPIVATSDQRGYKAIVDPADMEDVIHQWREYDSRIEDFEGSKKPLIRFYEKHGGAQWQTQRNTTG